MEISDPYLPDSCRADVRTGATPLHVIITDLHSGRIFGAQGHWVGDSIALLLGVSLTSGAFSYVGKRRLQSANHRKEPLQAVPEKTNGNDIPEVPVLVGKADGANGLD